MIALAFLLDQIMGVPKDQCHNLVLTMMLLNSKQLVVLPLTMLPVTQVTLLTLSLKNQVWCGVSPAGAIASSGAAFGGVPFASGGKSTCPCWHIFWFPWSSCWWFPCDWCSLFFVNSAGIPRAEGIRSILLLPLLVYLL